MKNLVLKAVLIPATVFFAAYFGAGFYDHQPTSSSDLAAWVQAFGSIAAIIGAVWVADRQHAKQTLAQAIAEREQRIRYLRTVLKTVRQPRDYLQTVVGDINTERDTKILAFTVETTAERFEEVQESIRTLEANAGHFPEAAIAMTRIRVVAKTVQQTFTNYWGQDWEKAPNRKAAVHTLSQCGRLMDGYIGEIEEALNNEFAEVDALRNQ